MTLFATYFCGYYTYLVPILESCNLEWMFEVCRADKVNKNAKPCQFELHSIIQLPCCYFKSALFGAFI
jgi:hypothetical protein